ncbi:MAG: hypothetical protein IPN17_08525 [Deltaproteobacteria bacterium]|nr:hypothetical protein [Deltaproteobacteria bacterium]
MASTVMAGTQTPRAQRLPVAQALSQAPQCAVLDRVSTSQPLAASPSQSAKPSLQLATPQTPSMHDGVPLAAAQTTPLGPHRSVGRGHT